MVKKSTHLIKSTCPIAGGLDIFGDHWTLLIIRDLLFEQKHEYKEFLSSDEKISSNILSARLKKMLAANIIAVTSHPENKLRKLYYLTDKGKDLAYVMLSIAKWSDKYLGNNIYIPVEKRPVLDEPIEVVIKMLKAQLVKWEKENILMP